MEKETSAAPLPVIEECNPPPPPFSERKRTNISKEPNTTRKRGPPFGKVRKKEISNNNNNNKQSLFQRSFGERIQQTHLLLPIAGVAQPEHNHT